MLCSVMRATQNIKIMDSTKARMKTAARMTVSRVVPRWSSAERGKQVEEERLHEHTSCTSLGAFNEGFRCQATAPA